MDIVRITLSGIGCDVFRGVITKKDYEKIKNSESFNDVWVKNLNKKISKKIKQEFHDYGITNGDIRIEVNGEEIINVPISVLSSYSFGNVELVDLEGYMYPVTKDIVITSIQNLEGVFMDTIFVTKDDFDIINLKFIQKEIQDKNEKTIIDSLISEVYYDGEIINFIGSDVDLRMSKVSFDENKNYKKDEKNID